MICLNRLLIYFISFIFCSAFAQDSINIDAIKAQISAEKKLFSPRSDFSKKQNNLLREHHEQKVDAELKLLDPKLVIVEGEIYNSVYAIFKQILTANPSIPQETRLVIYRSSVFNAFTMGDNVIFVNLGLLYSLKNESEIALVLAHEIAHNSLKHVESSMVRNVLDATNDSLRSLITTTAKQQYGVVSALNKLLMPRILESREQSRINEFAADSLGFAYLKHAGFNLPAAITMFQEMEEQTENLSDPLDFAAVLNLSQFPAILEKSKNYAQGGSLGSFEEDETWEPYLATHPYDRDRFVKLATHEHLDTIFENYERQAGVLYQRDHRFASYEMMNMAVKNKNLSEALYYACRHLSDFPGDQKSYEVIVNTLLSLSFTKERRTAGKYLDRQNPKQAEDYDRICAFAYALSPTECKSLAKDLAVNYLKEVSTSESQGHAMIKLFEFMESEKYEYFEALWITENNHIKESNYSWILKEIEVYLYNTKKIKFLNPNK